MKYSPGSFTKNFAWRGAGFLRLHETIKAGFSGTLQMVNQAEWRRNCGEESASMQLVPLNFFLHQLHIKGSLTVSVDELVYQSIMEPHSLAYDRLALFSFHLNTAGDDAGRRTGFRGWATWANEFVREDLSELAGWRANALKDASLLNSLRMRINAQPEVLRKCFTNYRYFFGLAEYDTATGLHVNTGYDDWIVPALFLYWDRLHLDSKAQQTLSLTKLVAGVSGAEIFKLVGTSNEVVSAQAELSAVDYIALGGPSRFGEKWDYSEPATSRTRLRSTKRKPSQKKPSALKAAKELSKADVTKRLSAMATLETDASVERRLRQRYTQQRNRELASLIKKLYDFKCLFCDSALPVGLNPDAYYAEAAHVKPLGAPHNGPDIVENLIPLCPNHHLQLDRGLLRIVAFGESLKIISGVPGDPLHGKEVRLHDEHTVNVEFIKYHYDWFARKR